MLQKTKGIVLHTLKYNDTSIIVDMYTELSGRASFLVAVPRSRKAAVKSVLFQPLSFIEFEADYRPNATLYRIKEAKSFYPFSSIPYDPYKSSMALFLSEFLYRAVREEAENPKHIITRSKPMSPPLMSQKVNVDSPWPTSSVKPNSLLHPAS